MPPDPAAEPSPVPGVSRNVFILGLVSLATDASSEMIYPLVPLFLTSVLGAPVAIVGVIEGLAEATASVLKGVSGWLSDRIGRRRPLVLAGYGLAAISKPLLALATGWPLVLAARVLDRFGKGVRNSPRDALIGDSSPEGLRGRAFGFHRATDQIGAVIGPLLALALLALFHQNLRALFVAAFVPAALGVAILTAVRETGRGPSPDAAPPRFRLRGTPAAFRRFLAVMLLFTLGNSSDMFLILRARQLGIGTGAVVLLFAVYNAVYAAASYPAGVISDRIGRKRVMVAGLAVFALVYAGFGLARGPGWVWLLFAVYGLYQGLTDGTSRALVVDLVSPGLRATALGVYAMATGLAALPASVIAGLLWQKVGPAAPFLYGAATAALACAGFSLVCRDSSDAASTVLQGTL
ncbi:MAG: MFS transporter [Bryobacteraceae bacterium]